MYNAIVSPAYLTAGNGVEQTPKISMGDDDNRTGVYRFSFQVNNLSDRERCTPLDGVALTDQVNLDYPGYTFYGRDLQGPSALLWSSARKTDSCRSSMM